MPRIYFLDNLRAFVVILVVVLHGSMVYMTGAPEWWYVVDEQRSLLFDILVLLIDVPIMLIMFFIAGYFARPSLVRRGPEGFLREKFVRVGVPWLFGVLFLAPITTYMIVIRWGMDLGYLEFWAGPFWGEMFQQSVYWYLGILFLLFFLLVLAYDISPRLRNAEVRVAQPGWGFFVGFFALMSVGMFIMSIFFPIDTWYSQMKLFVFQPLRLPLYIDYFALGIYAQLRGWFREGGYGPRTAVWGSIWLISGLLYLGNRLFLLPGDMVDIAEIIHVPLFNAFCFSSLLFGSAVFQRWFDKSTRFWSSLSANSYGIYYIHPLILYPIAYLFLSVTLPLAIKAPLVILLGIAGSWLVSEFVLRRAPVIKRAFG
jgi:surface polysaccharide O-acyltransferase-like enzyme